MFLEKLTVTSACSSILQRLSGYVLLTVFFFITTCSNLYGQSDLTMHSTVLVTIDTLRADCVGAYGSSSARTPYLDRVSKSGGTYIDVLTDVPLTLPSHCSLLTGLPVSQHGVHTNQGYALGPKIDTLATRYKQKGGATAAFIGGFPLEAQFGLNRDFDVYDDHLTRTIDNSSLLLERSAEEVISAALSWLDRVDHRLPFFLWVHLYDPHAPYEPPGAYKSMFPHPYFGEIAYTDMAFGNLFKVLHNRFRGTISPRLIVTADHGESLGDHREQTHGIFLYQATLKIPLLIKWESPSPVVIHEHPFLTIYDLFDWVLEPLSALAPTMKRPSDANRKEKWSYYETRLPYEKYRWSPIEGIRYGHWKYHSSPVPELFNLETDPAEHRNIIGSRPDIVEKMKKLLDSVNSTSALNDRKQTNGLDNKTLAALEALGYISNSGPVVTNEVQQTERLPDPKERIVCLEDIENGSELVQQNKFDQARPFLERAQRCDPTNPDVMNDLGLVFQNLAQFATAARMFEKALFYSPQNARYHNNLGSVSKKLNKIDQAINHFQKAIDLDPEFLPARLNLAIVYYETDQKDKACAFISTILADNPDWTDALSIAAQMSCD